MLPSRQKKMNARWACLFAASVLSLTTNFTVRATNPRLLVGVLIDGLENDRLEQMKDLFCADGFRRLMDQGVSIESLDYGPGIDGAAASAMLVTGASPSVNGIPRLKAYDCAKKVEYPIFATSSRGDYGDLTFTPASILVSTVSDEARVSTDGAGQVHSVAPRAWQAVVLAGHAGNTANFIDDNSGKWETPRFYSEVASPVTKRNALLPLSSRLDTISWAPFKSLDTYPGIPDYKKQFPFRYSFSRKDGDRYLKFKSSATGNREIAQTATDFVETLKLGTRGALDVLNLAFDVSPYPYGRDADVEVEQLDAYLRLDADLSLLFNAIDRTAGMDNAVIFVAGIPAEGSSPRPPERFNIPTGTFSPRRAISLLNLYLMAIHGNGDYVTGYHDGYFYLNRDLIRDKELSLQTVRVEAADFLARMSGVSETFTIDDIRAGRAGDDAARLRMNTSVTHAGDVLARFNPGWEITDQVEEQGKSKKKSQTRPGTVTRTVSTAAPAFILAPGLDAEKIESPVDARTLAPTVSRILRIRPPNAASLPPLKLASKR